MRMRPNGHRPTSCRPSGVKASASTPTEPSHDGSNVAAFARQNWTGRELVPKAIRPPSGLGAATIRSPVRTAGQSSTSLPVSISNSESPADDVVTSAHARPGTGRIARTLKLPGGNSNAGDLFSFDQSHEYTRGRVNSSDTMSVSPRPSAADPSRSPGTVYSAIALNVSAW